MLDAARSDSPRRYLVGTSGFVYPHWRDRFYPARLPQSQWFAHYAQHFATVELNNPFYRLPRESASEVWCRQAPPGFIYAVKASRFIAHISSWFAPEVFVILRKWFGPLSRASPGKRIEDYGQHLG